jgi:hypothetical protein
LKAAGLVWKPALLDFFAIPDRDLDDKIFVVSDILATIEELSGTQMVSFQGASEWALDALVTDEVVWLPGEAQIRQALEERLLAAGHSRLQLTSNLDGYQCEFQYQGQAQSFQAAEASEVYAVALLFLMQKQLDQFPPGEAGTR